MSDATLNNPVLNAGRVKGIALIAAAILACFSVVLINGGPLLYFDSLAYLQTGVKALGQLGIDLSPGGGTGGGVAVEGAGDDQTVNASRSAVFSIISSFATLSIGPRAVAVFNTLTLFFAVALLARVALRNVQTNWSPAGVFAVPLIGACLSTLPFYVAYLMPDLLLGTMLIATATLAAFSTRMTWIEIFFTYCLISLAIVSHLSHLAILALMIPAAGLVSAFVERRKWWLAPLILGLSLGTGLLERAAFKAAAESGTDAEVVYYPFITARLIQDRVGKAYLDEVCPDETLPTCALNVALSRSDDPYRLTATHIIFESDPKLGSFRLMESDVQRRVANDQVKFFIRVFLDRPFATTGALLNNSLTQARMNSIQMTVPVENILKRVNSAPGLPENLFPTARLSQDRDWIATVDTWHDVVNIVALVVLGGLMVWPGRVSARIRVFAAAILLGILANAFVCGGISQPADRYGSRAIWLVPFAATFMFLFSGLFSKTDQESDEAA